MKICTYNIHRAIGIERVAKPQRIVKVLQEIDADIIALQEVSFLHDTHHDLVKLLAAELGAEIIEGPTLEEEQGKYGNAVLTKIPVKKIEKIDLSIGRREPRGAINLFFEQEKKAIQLIATHLGLRPYERRTQVKQLLEKLDSDAQVKILIGDFNEWLRWGRPLRWLRKEFGPMPAPATFPAHRPCFALDRIWVKPRTVLQSLHVHNSQRANISSDHLPLVATLDYSFQPSR